MPSSPPKPLLQSGSDDAAADEDPTVSPRTRKSAAEDPVMTSATLASEEVGIVAAAASDNGDAVVSKYAGASGCFGATVTSPRYRSGQHDSTNAPRIDSASAPLYPIVESGYSCGGSFPLHQRGELLEDPVLEEIDFEVIDPILLATRARNQTLPNPYVPARGRGRSRSDAAARREPQTAETRPSSAATGSCSAAGPCLGTGRCLHGCVNVIVSLAACNSTNEGDATDDGGGWSVGGGLENGSGLASASNAGSGLNAEGGFDAGAGIRARNRHVQDGALDDVTLNEPLASGRFRPRSAPQPRPSHPRDD